MLTEDIEGLLDTEFDEFDEFDELAELDLGEASRRNKGRRPPPLRTPQHGNSTVKPPPSGYASKAELEATARKLDGRIGMLSNSVKSLDRRTVSTEREVTALSAALRKEIVLRKRETAELRKSVDESRQIAMILPLVSGGNDKLSKLMPMLMYGGMLGGSSSSTPGDSNGSMMTMMMVMAMSTL
ncbi:hypothetical protein [Sphingomonas sp. R86521]|uniref:hypothetical protein n=1 Tax=Sphingomonas sp. R86521 TaxID=3093860 RepID=UPI0036D43DEE